MSATGSIATEPTPAGPRILYLSRRDVVAVGGDHSDLYEPRTNYPIGILEGSLISAWRRRPGRESADEIIVLNPMGMAVADIACAAEVYTRACAQQVGTWLVLY